jgi:hypothetical protein
MPGRRSNRAAEFAHELTQDSAYQARLKARGDLSSALEAACAADEVELVSALRAVAPSLMSVWDFVAIGGAPASTIDILVRHLYRPHHARIWEGIVRALSSKHARIGALEPLRQLYRAESDRDRRWLIANAIGSMAGFAEAQDLDDIEQYRGLFRQSRKPPHVPPAP